MDFFIDTVRRSRLHHVRAHMKTKDGYAVRRSLVNEFTSMEFFIEMVRRSRVHHVRAPMKTQDSGLSLRQHHERLSTEANIMPLKPGSCIQARKERGHINSIAEFKNEDYSFAYFDSGRGRWQQPSRWPPVL